MSSNLSVFVLSPKSAGSLEVTFKEGLQKAPTLLLFQVNGEEAGIRKIKTLASSQSGQLTYDMKPTSGNPSNGSKGGEVKLIMPETGQVALAIVSGDTSLESLTKSLTKTDESMYRAGVGNPLNALILLTLCGHLYTLPDPVKYGEVIPSNPI